MYSNRLKKLLRNAEKFAHKYGLYVLIVLFIFGPFIINFIFIENLGFKKSEMLDYYGVVVSGVITFLVLRITIKNNNESLNKEIEIQKEIMKKQFEFDRRQKQVNELEIELKNILDNCRISKSAIDNFIKIPNYLSINTLDNILSPLSEFQKSITDLVIKTDDVYNKFELTLNSFIIIDELINCEEYKTYKFRIYNYINNYLNIIQKLNQEIKNIWDLIENINFRKQYYFNNFFLLYEYEIRNFANYKSNLNYYIGCNNTYKVIGWSELNKEISSFIKFLNEYIMSTVVLENKE